MPNVPNTNQSGLSLVSAGDGQNGTRFWGGNSHPMTYAVSGPLAIPSGASDYLPPFFMPVPVGQTWTLIGIRAMVRGATSVTVNIQQNGLTVAGLSGVIITTTATSFAPTNPAPVADGDYFAPVVTAISGTPDGLSCTFYFQVTP